MGIRSAVSLALAAGLICPVVSAKISTAEIAQYQYGVDVPECNIKFSDGSEIQFDGLFANNNSIFFEIINLVVPTTESFSVGKLVQLEMNGELWPAKIVRVQRGYVTVATEATLLGDLWFSGDEGSLALFEPQGRRISFFFSVPGDLEEARKKLSEGRTCYQYALNSH